LQSGNPVQDGRESMWVLQSRHAFAVTLTGPRYCKPSAKAWHPHGLVHDLQTIRESMVPGMASM